MKNEKKISEALDYVLVAADNFAEIIESSGHEQMSEKINAAVKLVRDGMEYTIVVEEATRGFECGYCGNVTRTMPVFLCHICSEKNSIAMVRVRVTRRVKTEIMTRTFELPEKAVKL